MDYSFFFTYYSILIFSNFSPIILFTSPIILFIPPIILNYAQSKQLSNRYITVLCEMFIQHYTEILRRLQTMYTNIRNDIYFLLIMSIMLE